MNFCPHCGGDLSRYLALGGGSPLPASREQAAPAQKKYDQTRTWQSLMEKVRARAGSPPDTSELGLAAAGSLKPHFKGEPVSTIVHLVFEKNIVPQGGILYQATMLDGRNSGNADQFESLGYSLEDGKVKMVDDMPVGPAYGALDYWGGESQHKRWHLDVPVTINPSRHGEPFFMDENMVAFGARWRDADRLDEGFLELLDLFEKGIGGGGQIALPVALEVVVRPM